MKSITKKKMSLFLPLLPGNPVIRGPDWKWGDQAGPSSQVARGTVVSKIDEDKWIKVQWKNGITNSYRYGADEKYDVVYSPQPGDTVIRGPDWKWENQDGNSTGHVVSEVDTDNWLKVRWSNTTTNSYRFGVKVGKKFCYDAVVLIRKSGDAAAATTAGSSGPESGRSTEATDGASQALTKGLKRVQLRVGDFCLRGADWKWQQQDRRPNPENARPPFYGKVLEPRDNDGWIKILWLTNSVSNSYRYGGATRKTDVVYAPQEGDKVVRGPNWKWGDQDGGTGKIGKVAGGLDPDHWLTVHWESTGKINKYRYNHPKGKARLFDIFVVARSGEEPQYELGRGAGSPAAGVAAAAAATAAATAAAARLESATANGVAKGKDGTTGEMRLTTKCWPGHRLETADLPLVELKRMQELRKLVARGSVAHLACNVTKLCEVDTETAPLFAHARGRYTGEALTMQLLDPSVVDTWLELDLKDGGVVQGKDSWPKSRQFIDIILPNGFALWSVELAPPTDFGDLAPRRVRVWPIARTYGRACAKESKGPRGLSCAGVWLPAKMPEDPPAIGSAAGHSYTLWSVEGVGPTFTDTVVEAFRLEVVEAHGDAGKHVRLGGIRILAVPAHVDGIEPVGAADHGVGKARETALSPAAVRGQAHATTPIHGHAATGSAARGALFDPKCAPLDLGEGRADTGLVGCVFDCTKDARMIVSASSEDGDGGNIVANVRGFVVPGTGALAGAGARAEPFWQSSQRTDDGAHWILISAPPGCVLRSITLLAAACGGAAGLAYAPATVILRGWAEGAKGGGGDGGGGGGGGGGSRGEGGVSMGGAGKSSGGGWTAPPTEQGAIWYDNDEFRWDGSIVQLLPAPPPGETDLRQIACARLELRGDGKMINVRVPGLIVTCERYMTLAAVAEREAAAERAHARRMDQIEERRAVEGGDGSGFSGFLGAAASAGAMASAATASQTLAKRAKAMSCVDALSSASSADDLVEIFLRMEPLAEYIDRATMIRLAKERRVALGSEGWTRQVAVTYGQVMRKIVKKQ